MNDALRDELDQIYTDMQLARDYEQLIGGVNVAGKTPRERVTTDLQYRKAIAARKIAEKKYEDALELFIYATARASSSGSGEMPLPDPPGAG